MSYTSSPTTLQLNGGGEGKRFVMKGSSETMKRYLKWINRTNAPDLVFSDTNRHLVAQ